MMDLDTEDQSNKSRVSFIQNMKQPHSKRSHIYYNGIPKTLLKRGSNPEQTHFDKDKLNYAKAKWMQKRGVNIL